MSSGKKPRRLEARLLPALPQAQLVDVRLLELMGETHVELDFGDQQIMQVTVDQAKRLVTALTVGSPSMARMIDEELKRLH